VLLIARPAWDNPDPEDRAIWGNLVPSMSKAYTDADLADQLDSDLTWRLKELSDLKAAIKNSQASARPVLLRSLVTMLYAHWEGHIRFCASKYFEHLTLKRLRYMQLEGQLYVNSFLGRLDALNLRRTSIEDRCRLVRDILDSADHRFARINPSLIDTRSNLSSWVLRDICMVCAIDYSLFESKAAIHRFRHVET
jgi:hypothetical protein